MGEDLILYEVDKERKIATITINRPEKLNALDFGEFAQITRLFREAEYDENVKVIIWRGVGRAFCVGDDLDTFLHEYGMTNKETGEAVYGRPHQRDRILADRIGFGPGGIYQTIAYCLKANICQVQGYCYGGALGMALACDMTIAAEGAIFGHAGYRYMGPSAEGLLIPMFLNLGIKRTMELMLTGRPIEAKEAERIGMVNKVVPPDRLDEEVQRYAEAIALLSLDGIVVGKCAKGLALDQLGVYGGMMGVVTHNLGTNIKWDPEDFNMLKERKKRGKKGAIRAREARYAHLGMDVESVKREAMASQKDSE